MTKDDYCTVDQAAEILHLSPSRVYHIKNKLPHIKCGDKKQSRILFVRDQLIPSYQNI